MIWNIVDHRKRRYRWKTINAVIEDVWHDNSCENSDQAEPDENGVQYDQRKGVSVREAILWAQGAPGNVTLFLYDEGDGI